MRHFAKWRCPSCGESVTARGAKDVFHQCKRKDWRIVYFEIVTEAKAS